MDKTLKTILIALLIVGIAVGGFLGYKYINSIIEDNLQLGIQKDKLEKLIKEKEIERDEAYSIVDSLTWVIAVADKEIAEKDKEIYELQDSLDNIPEVVEQMHPDARYDSLQVMYPDSSEKRKYKFTEEQVQYIYTDLLECRVIKGINEKLIDTNTLLKNQLSNSHLVEAELRVIIEGYAKENEELKDYINNINSKQIKVRTQRNIFAGASGGLLVILGIIIAL